MPHGVWRSVRDIKIELEILRSKEISTLAFKCLNFSDLKSTYTLKKKFISENLGLG